MSVRNVFRVTFHKNKIIWSFRNNVEEEDTGQRTLLPELRLESLDAQELLGVQNVCHLCQVEKFIDRSY